MEIGNRYTIIEHLGQGGMGVVYHARDRLTGQDIALKQVQLSPNSRFVTHPSYTSTHDAHLSLTREFRTLASLHHPNIISVLDYGYDDKQQPFYTMEYIQHSRDIRLVAQELDLKGKIHLLIELLQGLAYLHRRQIIHRDLKPSNIVVVDERVKLLDFGVAVLLDENNIDHQHNLSGSLAYMAPERFQYRTANAASDLYSVGLVAYELLTGYFPYNRVSNGILINDILTKQPELIGFDLPIALNQILNQLLAKSPEDRYQFAEDVIQDLYKSINEPIPPETTEVRQSYLQSASFIGRTNELEQLEQALTEAIDGHGSIWLIAGESGVGKSRLVDELRIRALVGGATVLRGQAVEGGRLPFQVWRNIARQLVLRHDITASEKRILKEIVSDISILLDEDIPDALPLEGNRVRQRLILTLVNIISRQTTPLVLLLEDLQWSGEADSLELVKQLHTNIASLPVLVIGNYRNDEAPYLADHIGDLPVITLERLNNHEIAELSASMLGDAGRQTQVVSLLQQETEGNCFFMVEVVQALADDAGRLAQIGHHTLPSHIISGGIRRIIQRRLEQVPLWGQPLLQYAAVAGRQLDLDVIRYLLEQQSDILPAAYSRDNWLNACAEAAVLEIQEQTWRFSHDRLREAVLQLLSDDQSQFIHRHIAEAIETIHPDSADFNEILLEHWHHAGDHDKEIYYLNFVAETLVDDLRSDFGRASQLIERGLKLLQPDDARRIRLLNWQSQAMSTRGDSEQAQVLAQAALELAEKLNDEAGIALSTDTLGSLAESLSDHATAQAYHERSLAMYQKLDDKKGIASSLTYLSIIAVFYNDYTQSLQYMNDSLATYREIADLRGEARVLNNIANIYDIRGDYEQALSNHQRSLELSQQLGDQLGIGMSYNNIGFIAYQEGNYEQAQASIEQSLKINNVIGNQRGQAANYSTLGEIHFEKGDFARARAYQLDSLTIRRVTGHKLGVVISLYDLGLCAYAEGDYALAQQYIEESLTLSQSIDNHAGTANNYHYLGMIAYQRGDYDQAHAYQQQNLEVGQQHHDNQQIADAYILAGFIYLKHQPNRAPAVFRQALLLTQGASSPSLILKAVVGFAGYYATQGNIQRAQQLAGMAYHHPFQATSIKLWLNDLLPQLDVNNDPLELKLRLQRARTLDLDTEVHNLLVEFDDTTDEHNGERVI